MIKRLKIVLLFFSVLVVMGSVQAFAIGNYGVNLNSDGYLYINPYYPAYAPGGRYGAQCTWYCWGRAYEKLGITLPSLGQADQWANNARASFPTGTEPRANSIMVEYCDTPGHVFFVEKVENGFAYVSESNYIVWQTGVRLDYHEDKINLNTMTREGWASKMKRVEYIYLDSVQPGTVTVSFKPNSENTSVNTTNAKIAMRVDVYGGKPSYVGAMLFDSNGYHIAEGGEMNDYVGVYYFDINSELNYTLKPGTTYQYQFYAVVNGETYYSAIESFTTSGASVIFTQNSKYTSVGETDASLAMTVSVTNGTPSYVGVILYDSSGAEVARGGEYNSYIGIYYFKVNEEIGYKLKGGANYSYRFYAVVNGMTYYSSSQYFKTKESTALSVSFSPWSDSSHTFVGETNAGVGMTVSVAGAVPSYVGMILYDSNGTELKRGGEANTWIGVYYFNINTEIKYVLSPGTNYKYQFYAVVNGETYFSDTQYFTTAGSASIASWQNGICLPSKRNALISVDAVASGVGTFESASLKLWNSQNVLIASKTENCSDYKSDSMNIWYDVLSDTSAELLPNSTYTYQFSVVFSGKQYDSDKYSFKTSDGTVLNFGIDVSQHQGAIDWNAVLPYIDYAIIRCGIAADYSNNDDAQWLNNVFACESLGIPYGVYLYSYAENDEEAISEADHVIRLLKGHSPSLPVYYDLEDPDTTQKLSNGQILRQAQLFCEKVEKAGYEAGVYSSKSWWDSRLTAPDYNEYYKWVAGYGGVFAGIGKECDVWQYSSNGFLPGIGGSVDLNYSFEGIKPMPQKRLISSVAQTGNSFKVIVTAVSGDDRIVLALYQKGQLVDCKIVKANNSVDFTADVFFDAYKVMLLDKVFAPLCEAWTT